jgi:hypothetical protein
MWCLLTAMIIVPRSYMKARNGTSVPKLQVHQTWFLSQDSALVERVMAARDFILHLKDTYPDTSAALLDGQVPAVGFTDLALP